MANTTLKRPPAHGRIWATLPAPLAAEFDKVRRDTGMDDSALIGQGVVRLVEDVKKQGALVIRPLPKVENNRGDTPPRPRAKATA